MGANRGLCKQACRRIYHGKESGFLFSLKDSQLIDFIPDFSRLGISSIKIEGRLKPAEYVYRVAKAYRMALDDNSRIDEAKKILELDLGREKTQYFMGGNVSDSITQAPATGKNLGLIVGTNQDSFVIESDIPLVRKSRLRVFSAGKSEHFTFKIEDAESNNGLCRVFKKDHPAKTGDIVFLAGIPEKNFPSKIQSKLGGVQSVMPQQNKNKILRSINIKQKPVINTELIIRINELAWLPKVDLRDVNYLILNLSLKEWKDFNPDSGLIKKFQDKIIIELPKFIPEEKISIYKNLCKTLFSKGIKKFSLSHMSQKLIVPETAWLMANENVYTFNDFSILGIKSEGIRDYIRPLESDYPNLLKGKDRFGIIPIYFHPHLFVSRMPVKTGDTFREEIDGVYIHHVVDGITYVIPEIPVSLTQYINKLSDKGFKRYLVDLSFTKVSSNRIKTISKRIKNSEQIQPATNFNFKLEMK
jgi:putative protease